MQECCSESPERDRRKQGWAAGGRPCCLVSPCSRSAGELPAKSTFDSCPPLKCVDQVFISIPTSPWRLTATGRNKVWGESESQKEKELSTANPSRSWGMHRWSWRGGLGRAPQPHGCPCPSWDENPSLCLPLKPP